MRLPAPFLMAVTAALSCACVAQPMRLDAVNSCGIAGIREKVLQRVNAARAGARSCGSQRMAPAPPLAWNDALFSAAARHSRDMARGDYFDHASPDGRRVGARATEEGYRWRTVGENIAGGDRSVELVVSGWMDSPGHCRNIMNAEFSEVGVACAQRRGTTWGTYWTMVLGRPR
jgi:uncharacterized protein YkwD